MEGGQEHGHSEKGDGCQVKKKHRQGSKGHGRAGQGRCMAGRSIVGSAQEPLGLTVHALQGMHDARPPADSPPSAALGRTGTLPARLYINRGAALHFTKA